MDENVLDDLLEVILFGTERHTMQTQIADLDKLISDHTKSCCHISNSHSMRRVAPYTDILRAGEAALPLIIDRLRRGRGRTSLYVLLRDIACELPYKPERIEGSVFARWDVRAEGQAWIEWFDSGGFVK